jgi:glycosyltransferase involved in cell wall biosynthesis
MKTDKHPLVSVIIPTYNRAHLIGKTLDSVFAQTYQNFEIIVVDDGSTDNTVEVLRPLAETEKLKYIRQNNQGASLARNRGIKEARGSYIAFLDSDDLFEPAKLELQINHYREMPELGLVHSGFTKFSDSVDDLGYRDTSWFSGEIYPQILWYWTTLMAMDTVIVARHVFDSVGLFDSTLIHGEDLDMWRRIARRYSFGFINRSLARVRIHEGNISRENPNAAGGLVKYLEKAFQDDPSLSTALKRRVFSSFYSAMAYNLLGESGGPAMQAARQNAKLSMRHNPLNYHAYMAFISTFVVPSVRKSMVTQWRLLRSAIMSRKRAG